MTDLAKRPDRSPVPSAFEYAPAPESREIVSLDERYGLFVGGEWLEPRSGEHQLTVSPATEEPVADKAYEGAGE